MSLTEPLPDLIAVLDSHSGVCFGPWRDLVQPRPEHLFSSSSTQHLLIYRVYLFRHIRRASENKRERAPTLSLLSLLNSNIRLETLIQEDMSDIIYPTSCSVRQMYHNLKELKHPDVYRYSAMKSFFFFVLSDY